MKIEIAHGNLGILIDALSTAIQELKIQDRLTYVADLQSLKNSLEIEHAIKNFETARALRHAAKQYRTTPENPLTGEVHS